LSALLSDVVVDAEAVVVGVDDDESEVNDVDDDDVDND